MVNQFTVSKEQWSVTKSGRLCGRLTPDLIRGRNPVVATFRLNDNASSLKHSLLKEALLSSRSVIHKIAACVFSCLESLPQWRPFFVIFSATIIFSLTCTHGYQTLWWMRWDDKGVMRRFFTFLKPTLITLGVLVIIIIGCLAFFIYELGGFDKDYSITDLKNNFNI